MRGLTYALAEIAGFMVAATLIGYLFGRLAGPSRWSRRLRRQHTELRKQFKQSRAAALQLDGQFVAVSAHLDAARLRILELEVENENLPTAEPARPASQGDARPIAYDEVDALLAEIDKQEAMIGDLEEVVAEAPGMALGFRNARRGSPCSRQH